MSDMLSPHSMTRRIFVASAALGASLASTPNESVAANEPAELPPKGSNFGQCADDQSLRAAWKQFCRQLEVAGDHVFKSYTPATPLHRADGFRFLTQNLGQAFDMAFETADPKYPTIFTFATPYCKIGGDNGDQVEHQAWIDGESIYRVTGNRGTVRVLNFTIMAERPEMQPGTNKRSLMWPFGDPAEANVFGHNLETDWEGNFELYIGGPKRGPNWLPTTPRTARLYIRQIFDQWSETPARLRIERIGMSEPRPVPTPQDMVKAMKKASRFMTDLMNDWPEWPYELSSATDKANINKFPSKRRDVQDPTYDTASDKLRGRSIINMTWRLAPDEALILAFDKPDYLWMMTNYGTFFNSMDYLYRPVTWTASRTKTDSDGKVRMILAHHDPGYHNWIDTQGFVEGNITNRNYFTTVFTEIDTQVVKFADLAQVMPADTVKVTKEERAQQMIKRFHAYQLRYQGLA